MATLDRMAGPLGGIRILDLTTMISGPVATRILADQGADVIKVEAPGGDLSRSLGGRKRGMAPIFAVANRNKRSIVLDLKKPGALALLERLVAQADVLVQNFRPGAAERIGIGEPAMRAIKPDLIYVSISGFGERGPYSHKRVYDPVIQALSGLASIQGAGGRPRMLRLIVPDKLTAVTAAQAITAALLQRERSGEGQHVKLAMLDAVVEFHWPEAMAQHTFIGSDIGTTRPSDVRDLVFETADGFITAGTVSDAEWDGFCKAAAREDLKKDPRFANAAGRVKHADARLEAMAETLKTRESAHWLRVLDEAQVPCAPILSRKDLLEDPQVTENEMIFEDDHPTAGRMRQPRPAARFSAAGRWALRRHAPNQGEHSEEVLHEVGVSEGEIAELRRSGVLGTSEP